MGFMGEKALETHILFAQKTLDPVLRESFVSLGRSKYLAAFSYGHP
jgi:hypothetical protein